MSVTSNQSVFVVSVTRSPIIITLEESDPIPANYRYLVKVYAWQGAFSSPPSEPIATLTKPPDLNDLGRFDVSPVLRDKFKLTDPQTTAQSEEAVWNWQFEYGKKVGDTETIEGTVTQRNALNGWLPYGSTINVIPDYADLTGTKKFLTVRPQDSFVDTTTGHNTYMSVYWFGDSGGSRYIWMRNQDGSLIDDLIEIQPSSVTDSADRVQTFNFGYEYISSLVNYDNNNKYYEVFISDSGNKTDPNPTIDDLKRFWIPQNVCDVGMDTISFINRFGVWDYLCVYAAQKESLEVMPEMYEGRIGRYDGDNEFTYDLYEAQKRVFRNTGKRKYNVETNYINEAHNEWLHDLFLSRNLYSTKLQVPLLLEGKTFTEKYDFESELINYQMQFAWAVNYLQNIR